VVRGQGRGSGQHYGARQFGAVVVKNHYLLLVPMPLKAIMQKGVRALFLLSTAAHASPCREDRFSLFCKPRAGKWELSVGICPKTFSCSMFDNVVSCVLAAVLTGRDFLRVCPCEHDPHRDREFSALLVRQGRQTRALSDIRREKRFLPVILTGQFARSPKVLRT
jgi:hypothetical protein